MSFDLDAKPMSARVQTVDNPRDSASGMTTTARFVVDPKSPGPIAA